MTRKAAKTIDQFEADETFIFRERNASDPAPQKEDKRAAPKEFVIERDQTGLCFIKYTAGGEVPDALKGKFTAIWRAQDAIDNFIATRKQQQGGAAG